MTCTRLRRHRRLRQSGLARLESDDQKVGHLAGNGPLELVRDEEGTWYVSHAGVRQKGTVPGEVGMAVMTFAAEFGVTAAGNDGKRRSYVPRIRWYSDNSRNTYGFARKAASQQERGRLPRQVQAR